MSEEGKLYSFAAHRKQEARCDWCTEETVFNFFFSLAVGNDCCGKPTLHCGRWSGNNHLGSCSWWGHCSPSGSGICNDKVLIKVSISTNFTYINTTFKLGSVLGLYYRYPIVVTLTFLFSFFIVLVVCVKCVQNKSDLYHGNELISLPLSFIIRLFSSSAKMRGSYHQVPLSAGESSNIYLTQPIQLATQLHRTRPFCSELFSC